MLSQDFINKMHQKLLDQKAKFEEELKNLPEHEEIGNRLDDAALEQTNDEVSHEVASRIRADLQDIDDALVRINTGTYGLDVDTGAPIEEKRLEVYPWAKKAI